MVVCNEVGLMWYSSYSLVSVLNWAVGLHNKSVVFIIPTVLRQCLASLQDTATTARHSLGQQLKKGCVEATTISARPSAKILNSVFLISIFISPSQSVYLLQKSKSSKLHWKDNSILTFLAACLAFYEFLIICKASKQSKEGHISSFCPVSNHTNHKT